MALIDINTLNKSNKLFRTIPLLIFAIALGIGIFYAGYFFGKLKMQNEKLKIEQKKKENLTSATPEQQPMTDPTTDWLVYRNTSFPFTFRYPKEAQIREEENTVVLIIKGPTQRESTEVYDAVYLRFSISDSQGKSLEEYVVEELNKSKELGEIIQPMEQIQINGIQGLAYTVRTTGTLRNIYLASPTGKIIKIVDGTNDPTNQGFKKISQNILATFEFLD